MDETEKEEKPRRPRIDILPAICLFVFVFLLLSFCCVSRFLSISRFLSTLDDIYSYSETQRINVDNSNNIYAGSIVVRSTFQYFVFFLFFNLYFIDAVEPKMFHGLTLASAVVVIFAQARRCCCGCRYLFACAYTHTHTHSTFKCSHLLLLLLLRSHDMFSCSCCISQLIHNRVVEPLSHHGEYKSEYDWIYACSTFGKTK